jgi:hypothetical protein
LKNEEENNRGKRMKNEAKTEDNEENNKMREKARNESKMYRKEVKK